MTRSRLVVPWLALAAAVGIVAGCNASSPSTPAVAPCALPSGTQVALVYPAPDATGIPDNLAAVIVAASTPLPQSWQALLTVPLLGTAQGSVLSTVPASPLPSPAATPPFPNAVYQLSGFVVQLPPASLVAVTLNDLSSNCFPPYPLRSFTSR